MNCANHPETAATAFCRECGKPMCSECQRPALGSIYCQDHVPVTVPPSLPAEPRAAAGSWSAQSGRVESFADSPYSAPGAATPLAPPNPNAHPVLALLLGFIPGVGAIYNGQYAKGLIHAVIFGLLISLISNAHYSGAEPFLGIMIAVWTFYQVFEAYHTARKRRYGIAVDEFSSLVDLRPGSGKFPLGAVLLIGLGFVLLLDTTNIIRFEDFTRFWPLGLIILGGYMLYNRLNPGTAASENGGVRQ